MLPGIGATGPDDRSPIPFRVDIIDAGLFIWLIIAAVGFFLALLSVIAIVVTLVIVLVLFLVRKRSVGNDSLMRDDVRVKREGLYDNDPVIRTYNRLVTGEVLNGRKVPDGQLLEAIVEWEMENPKLQTLYEGSAEAIVKSRKATRRPV